MTLSPVLDLALDVALGCVALASLLVAWRLWRGPAPTDRILALDTLYLHTVALVLLLGLRWATPWLFEAALIVALLGVVATVALARFLMRGDVVE